LAKQERLVKLTENILAYPEELRRRDMSEMMHAQLPAQLRDIVYSYIFPISAVRVHNAYMPSVRGTMNTVRFIMNDPRALIPHSGAASEVEPAIFAAPISPNAEILSDAVAEELKAYFYRTTIFKFGARPDLIDRCLYTSSFPYQLRKVSVTFRAALHYSGRYVEDAMQLHALAKLFELPLNVNIAVIIDPDVARYNRFLGMVKVAFPILDALEEQGYALSLLLEPVWRFEWRRKWVLESEEQRRMFVWTPKNTDG
jgi:hypothetical protein